jgi:PAS domain-containing protein
VNPCTITSFATYQDLVGFADAVEKGCDFYQALNYGDNGRGASGHVTAQVHTPMCALSKSTIEAKWGSLSAAWGKKVVIVCQADGDRKVIAELADYCSSAGICDLNPAALEMMGWKQDEELSADGQWDWLD